MLDVVLMILKDRDRTPAWLCRQAGISHALFTLMKKGQRMVTQETQNQFSDILGIRKEILFKTNKEK